MEKIREELVELVKNQMRMRTSVQEFLNRINEALRPAVKAEGEVEFILEDWVDFSENENGESRKLALTLEDGQISLLEGRKRYGGEWEKEEVDIDNLPIATLRLNAKYMPEALEFFAKKLIQANEELDTAIAVLESFK